MRNEGPFVLEWIAHHRALGVSDFLVYTNDCDDGTDALLDALAAADIVTHVRQTPEGRSVQWQALRAAKDHPAYALADWALCIDCDEFVVLKEPHADLPGLIGAAGADAILLPWRLFGSGGHLDFAEEPVTARFLRAAPVTILFPAAARFFKTLFRVAAFRRPGVHRPKPKPGHQAHWVDGSGKPLPPAFAEAEEAILNPVAEVACGAVQLNHYSLRSAEDFLVKRRRGLPNRSRKALDAAYWAERNFASVEDASALRHAPARKAGTRALLALPGVAGAHEACVAAHRASIAELLATADEARLFTRLALLPASVPPDEATARRLLAIVQRAGG